MKRRRKIVFEDRSCGRTSSLLSPFFLLVLVSCCRYPVSFPIRIYTEYIYSI